MLMEHRGELSSEWVAMCSIAAHLGYHQRPCASGCDVRRLMVVSVPG
jgi:hypothetical protein